LLLLRAAPPASGQTTEELAKQTQNPVASLITVPIQGNWDFGMGDRDATGTLLYVQPVMPFGISKSTNIILRVVMPLTSQPGPDNLRINGLGDVVTTVFFSPTKTGRVIWGAGPVFLLPAATSNALGSEKFGLGPSVVALVQPGKWTVGFLVSQIWSVSGVNDRDDVDTTLLQPFLNYNFGGGLAAGVELEATANWEAEATWSAPLIFTVSKVAKLRRMPVNFVMGAGPILAGPATGPGWRLRLQANLLFPR
jgi:hypothetical protein